MAAESAHKSRLISEARHLESIGALEHAVLLYQQGATIEQHLAEAEEQPLGPSKKERLLSAASCLGHSGDLDTALALFDAVLIDAPDMVRRYIRVLELRRSTTGPLRVELARALEQRDNAAATKLAEQGVGLIPPRVLWWLKYRTAITQDEARDALERLIVAVPLNVRFHLVYQSLLAESPGDRRLTYARYIVEGFPGEFAAHVGLARALDKKEGTQQAWREVLAEARSALELIRQDRTGAVATSASFVSLAYATAAVVSQRMGATENALAYYNEGLRVTPFDPELRTLYGLTLLQATRRGDALEELTRAFTSPRRRSHWSATLGGTLLLEAGRALESLPLLTIAANDTHGVIRAKALNNKGVALAMLEDLPAALDAFAEAVAVDPSLASARDNLRLLLSAERPAHPTLELPDFSSALDDLTAMDRNAAEESIGELAA